MFDRSIAPTRSSPNKIYYDRLRTSIEYNPDFVLAARRSQWLRVVLK